MSAQTIAYHDGQSLFCPACVAGITAGDPDLRDLLTPVADAARLPEAEPQGECYECSRPIF